MINMKSPEIRALRGVPPTARLTEEYLAFSRNATLEVGMDLDRYLHFERLDGGIWLFICNDDPDGFRLTRKGTRNPGLQVYCRPLISLIRKDVRWPLPASFYVQRCSSVTSLEGCTPYEILFQKPIARIGQ